MLNGEHSLGARLRAIERGDIAMGAVAAVLVALPALRMVSIIRSGTRTQHADYWYMIPGTFSKGGGLELDGALHWSNEHPVFVPKVLYWINAKLFGGSNFTLGYLVIVIVLAAIVVIAALIRPSVSRPTFVAAVVAAAALLLSPQGAWNFFKSMSGIAWLTANTLCLATIYLRMRGKRFAALAPAALASLSYGTGLMTWPALLLVGLVRDRKPLREWPALAGMAITFTWYLTRLSQSNHGATTRNYRVIAPSVFKLSGSIFSPTDGHMAHQIGMIGIIVGVVLAALAFRADAKRNAPWIGLFAYSVGGMVLIAMGRILFADFLESRYSSLPALLWVSILLLAVSLVPWDAVAIGLCAAAILAGSLTGRVAVDELKQTNPTQDLLAIAQRLELADGSTRFSFFGKFPTVTPTLENMHHYPFNGSFTKDCGLLGTRLPASGTDRALPLGGSLGAVTSITPMGGVPHAVEILGHAEGKVRCVVVADSTRKVIGIGVTGYQLALGSHSPPDAFTAMAPSGHTGYRVYIVPG